LARAIIASPNFALWAFNDATREQLAAFVCDLEYGDDDSQGGTTTSLPALLALPLAASALIPRINKARTELVAYLRKMDKERTPDGLVLSKFLLGKVNLRRFNRKATARQFVELQTKPDAVSFMWTQTNISNRTTKEQALGIVGRKITNTNDSELRKHLLLEQAAIYALPDHEDVARVYPAKLQPRVNIIVGRERVPGTTALLPIIYPGLAGESLPNYVPLPPSKEDKLRIKRSNTLIEQDAFAPLVKLHRYKQL